MRALIAPFVLLLAGVAGAADNSASILQMSESELAAETKAGVDTFNKDLPSRVNATTILQSVSYTSFNKVYMYRYETTFPMNEKAQRAALVKQQCASPNLSAFMKRGITLRSLYFGPDRKMTDIEVRAADCAK
ncbi:MULTISPECIES: hypothetical protein [unclassified Variovorax]|uniref:hypothetical protein n=1 Tax=unclassified Variovorax TaxID=663243 RepID=UPI00076C7CFE|nr:MULTISPECIES: hypothetical protein [unclassified Variovorax]KWT98158.1 hypothetical protein APY03_0829 [Variovorax sp. WDL1]PNG50358.1 hypothetical protein CHC06_05981 [Variovorax sp. B2]PNG51231.1 hypothetical protein CHC07_05887 [Variovorax sp. B4]VTV17464.1 hypothetical protein WDL1P1_00408 [Variovorax sp. WDL1]